MSRTRGSPHLCSSYKILSVRVRVYMMSSKEDMSSKGRGVN